MIVAPPPACALHLEIEAARDALAGHPMWLAVTMRNHSAHRAELGLPALSLWQASALGIAVASPRGSQTIPAADPDDTHGAPPGYALAPGEARTFTLDLSELCPDLDEGEHGIELSLPRGRAAGRCRLRVHAPTDAERHAASRLLRAEGWLASLVLDKREPAVAWPALSARTREALRLHVVLRRATWLGNLAELPLSLFDGFAGALASEAAVLAYEVARAGHDPSTGARRRVARSRWPSVAWRLAEIDTDGGELLALRELARA